MTGDIGYPPEFQARLMNDDANDKEYFFQDVTDILSIIVVTKLPTLEKDEQAVLGYYEESRMIQSESNVELNVMVICSTFRKGWMT